MVQGPTKGGQSKPNNNARRAHKAAANTKKGRRMAAPKKAAAIKQASMHKASFPPHSLTSPYIFFLGTHTEIMSHIGTECQNK